MSATSPASRHSATRRGGPLAALLAALALVGCYPELDWREVTSAEGGYAVLLPAKPERASREVAIADAQLELNMAWVHKEGMAFGAAYAVLPPGAPAKGPFLDAARDALARNVGGRVTRERALEIDGHPAREFAAEGAAEGEPMRLAARVLVANGRFYQVVFVGRGGRGEDADVTMFLESFRLTAR